MSRGWPAALRPGAYLNIRTKKCWPTHSPAASGSKLGNSINMRLSFGLEHRQLQVQKLAPRMIQSMEILQLPLQELQERIEQELAENPILELQERDPELPDEPDERESPKEKSVDDKELIVDEKHDNADDFERLLNLN